MPLTLALLALRIPLVRRLAIMAGVALASVSALAVLGIVALVAALT